MRTQKYANVIKSELGESSQFQLKLQLEEEEKEEGAASCAQEVQHKSRQLTRADNY